MDPENTTREIVHAEQPEIAISAEPTGSAAVIADPELAKSDEINASAELEEAEDQAVTREEPSPDMNQDAEAGSPTEDSEKPLAEPPLAEPPLAEPPLAEETPQNESEPPRQESSVQDLLGGTGKSEEIEAMSDDDIVVSSDSDSESEASSDDSDSSSESESDSGSVGDADDANDLDEEEAITGPIVSKNESLVEQAPTLPADYKVPENAPLEYVGDISALVESSAIIKANVSGEFRILKDNSVLCFEDREVLGPLFETFGRLQTPNYRVKFNNAEDFEKIKDKKGCKVYYVVPESEFLYTDSIKKFKGTDASNCHDEEIPEEEQEFSDDEQESAAKQERSRKKKQKRSENGQEPPKKKQSGPKPDSKFVSYGFAPSSAPSAPQPTAYTSVSNRPIHASLPNPPPATQQPAPQAPSPYGVPISQVQQYGYQGTAAHYNQQWPAYQGQYPGYGAQYQAYGNQYAPQQGQYNQAYNYQQAYSGYQQPYQQYPAFQNQHTPNQASPNQQIPQSQQSHQSQQVPLVQQNQSPQNYQQNYTQPQPAPQAYQNYNPNPSQAQTQTLPPGALQQLQKMVTSQLQKSEDQEPKHQ